MKFFYFFQLSIVLLFIAPSYAQNAADQYPAKSIIVHKTKDFTRDASKLWIDINSHEKPSNLNYDPQLFLTWKIDKSDSKKNAQGYDYYRTNLLFGFKDQDEFYELPYTFYGGTGNKFFTHAVAYDDKRFYVLAYDLVDAKTRNLVLFKFSKEQGLSSYILTSDPNGMKYPWLDLITHGEKVYPTVGYYNPTADTLEKYYINENFLKSSGELDATHVTTDKNNFSNAKYYGTLEKQAEVAYETSNPNYDHKAYLLGKNVIVVRTEINRALEKQDVKKYDRKQLDSSEKEGWRYVKDWFNRDTTTLFFQYRTDSSDFKTDAKNNKYYKARLRFGFKDDPQFYELPGDFYILYSEELETKFYSDDGMALWEMELKPPCLLFNNETFYIFVPNYLGQEKYEGTLFTYRPDKGLTREILFSGDNRKLGWFAYFTPDKESNFALVHVDNELNNVLKTYPENNQWLTKSIDLAVYYPQLLKKYKFAVKTTFLMSPPEPYEKPVIDDSLYRNTPAQTYNVLTDFSIFTNSEADKNRLKELQNSKDLNKRGYYIASFNNTEIKKRTNFVDVPHSRILISYMPETKDQYPFESCESYAYAALYKQFIDSDWQITRLREKEPGALKNETDVSYFGMQQYVRGNKFRIDPANAWMYPAGFAKEIAEKSKITVPEFNFDWTGKKGYFFEPFEIVLQNENNLDSISRNVENYFFQKLKAGLLSKPENIRENTIYYSFKKYFQDLYQANKNNIKSNDRYKNEIAEIHEMTGIPVKNIDLQKAFAAPTLEAFYYIIFFTNTNKFVRLEYTNNLNSVPYENPSDAKNKIIKILESGRPVAISVYAFPNNSGKKDETHKVLVSGYKKVKDLDSGKIVDLFKMHNSWGKDWDYQTNEGWFLADRITYSLVEKDRLFYLSADKALPKEYVENTDVYRRVYNNQYTENRLAYIDRPVGETSGVNQKDASVLTEHLSKKSYGIDAVSDIYIKYFKELGYEFQDKNIKVLGNRNSLSILKFKGIEVEMFSTGSKCIQRVWITTDTLAELETLKSRMDFSKIKGVFTQSKFSDGGYYLEYEKFFDCN